jgi:hypothetical protein
MKYFDGTLYRTQTFLEKSLVPYALSGPECCSQVGLSALGRVRLSALGEVGLSAPGEVALSAIGQVGLSALGQVRLSAVGEGGLSAPGEVCARQQVHYSSRTMAPVH